MIALRPLRESELEAASQLCLRSKAHWGYDADFMRRCEAELTLAAAHLTESEIVAAIDGDRLVGIAQVAQAVDGCFLEKLFVDPGAMNLGTGRRLFEWAVDCARGIGATQIVVEADPDAVPFYRKMGCKSAGSVPSASIPDRQLPRLVFDLG
ncbi:GNAT family N-acetyltransferase [Qipengyuania mesophila]|uniref:GNAT family N-acetyltransferase n=1 Tax=Qipengyuania mesophila TaxID=2867246 RepID=UPI003513E6D0